MHVGVIMIREGNSLHLISPAKEQMSLNRKLPSNDRPLLFP